MIGGLHLAPHEGGLDGKLTVSAINQHQELYPCRPSVIEQGVESGPDGASRVEHVVHQHHILPCHGKLQVALLHQRLGADGGEIVAVQGDVQAADRNLGVLDLADDLGDTLR